MNVFLAGATGAVGRPTISILVARGHRVFAMTRNPGLQPEIWQAGAIPVVQNAFDAVGLRQALVAIRPEAVVHQLTDLALLRDPERRDEALERNARLRKIGTANLVSAAVAAGVEYIVAQSIAWIYGPGPEPYLEDAPLDVDAPGLLGVSVDGVTALEAAVLSTPGLRGCVLRYGRLYGPGTGTETAGEMPLHVHAAAWAAVLAVEKQARGVYNVAEANPHVSTDSIRIELGWNERLRT